DHDPEKRHSTVRAKPPAAHFPRTRRKQPPEGAKISGV
ncbi:MAG: hypothetical protein AVDCRST_MAG56-7974, partial [uncultured Cytophagales bacterium]